jgi:hypothetical protein
LNPRHPEVARWSFADHGNGTPLLSLGEEKVPIRAVAGNGDEHEVGAHTT